MKYLNLGAELYQSEPCMTASDAQGWTWFKLVSYCHQQMNGGKIACAEDWPERHWLRIGVERAVVMADSPLWHFSGLILHVHFYNQERENAYKKTIADGKKGARKRWGGNRTPNRVPTRTPNRVEIGLRMRKKERKKELPRANGQIAHTP